MITRRRARLWRALEIAFEAITVAALFGLLWVGLVIGWALS